MPIPSYFGPPSSSQNSFRRDTGREEREREEMPRLIEIPLLTHSTASAATTISRSATVRVLLTAFTILLVLHLTISPPSKSTYHSLFLSLSDNATAACHLLALTRRPHVAGTPANAAVAAYVLAALSFSSLPAHSVSYDVFLTYPLRRSLILSPSPRPSPGPTLAFDLVQEIYPGDPYADVAAEVLPTFHAYARSGAAAGPAAYANYGRLEDFAALRAAGVNVTGAVVLARYGKIYRGDIIKNAEDAGAAAAVVFTDAKDYGGGGQGRFPEGPGMPASGVQVGSTYRGSGDPTTPGWASASGCERWSAAEVAASGLMPGIPSLPVSAQDGEAILRTIGGQVAPDDWQGVEGAPLYRLGPGPGFLNLTYIGNETLATIQNVFAVIEGEEEPDRYVLLGNHRDAWTFGAVDPNSGTASLLEVAQRFGKLQKRGWKPRRTIILCNWDAEEYGLIGSTEWVEENREMLTSRAVAYLNVDSAVAGPGFHASATPQLDELLKQVQDPDNSSQTLYESWVASNYSSLIGRLGGGGTDFTAFVQHVGVPSVDMFFGGGYPVYHSMYDDFVWMEKFGDPMFHRHVAEDHHFTYSISSTTSYLREWQNQRSASMWGLVALRLADEEFLPFNYISYASELQRSAKILEDDVLGMPVTFAPLYKSIKALKKAATKIDNQRKALERNFLSLNWRKDPLKVRELNDRLMMAERAFTDRDGLFGREWYKHLIYGPSMHDDYGSKSYPGIDDAIEKAKSLDTSESWSFVQHEVWRAARVVTQAALVLNGKFT
ncbi:probable glutamate carboxypeptidase LAMP1 isoform X2 [Elaeis guineensis]|uniref:probable glutamate carboxypeptidase LAMP1 isoform X2 n=1 Tax=Elaeis guineensis var. tenera TaxID=51953 RepID=UPI003C6D285E